MSETNGTSAQSVEEKISLIEQHLQEVLDKHIYEDVLRKENRPLCIYWGMLDHSLAHAPE
jgi:hypothetical protein